MALKKKLAAGIAAIGIAVSGVVVTGASAQASTSLPPEQRLAQCNELIKTFRPWYTTVPLQATTEPYDVARGYSIDVVGLPWKITCNYGTTSPPSAYGVASYGKRMIWIRPVSNLESMKKTIAHEIGHAVSNGTVATGGWTEAKKAQWVSLASREAVKLVPDGRGGARAIVPTGKNGYDPVTQWASLHNNAGNGYANSGVETSAESIARCAMPYAKAASTQYVVRDCSKVYQFFGAPPATPGPGFVPGMPPGREPIVRR